MCVFTVRQLLQIFVFYSATAFASEHEGNHCQLQIPDSPNILNITKTHDFIVNLTTNEYLRINLCTSLSTKCAHRSGYAACFHNANGTELGAGKFPPKLSSYAGNYVLTYMGDQCNATHNFTARFELECDTSNEINFAIANRDYTFDGCEFYVVLKNVIACWQPYSCSLRHQTQYYSLDRLRNRKTNYVITINRNLSVILNVCHRLIFMRQHSHCGSKSAICLIDQSNYPNITYRNLGNIEDDSGIKYAGNGVIKIQYENGVMCDNDKLKRLKSTISFICDINAKEGYADYAGGLESCDLLFVWKTAAACSEKTLMNKSLLTRQPCRVTDPISGYTYDFWQLSGGYKRFRKEGRHYYEYAVCSAVHNRRCPVGSGMCKTTSSTTTPKFLVNFAKNHSDAIYLPARTIKAGGMANTELLWSPRMGPYLDYVGGDQCAIDQYRNTVIKFVCTYNSILENSCSTTINVATDLACPNICPSSRHTQFDSLMNLAVRYQMKRKNIVYSFNACPSINPREYVDCAHALGGICLSTYLDNQIVKETSLGYPEPLPMIAGKRSTVLKFVNGSICEENKITKISSQISLICDVNVIKSLPDFHKYEKCVYYFEWRSRRSCGIVDCKMNADCSIENEMGHRWSLTFLREAFVYSVPFDRLSSIYKISVCGKSNAVNDSFISTEDTNFGRLLKVTSDYSKDITLKLYFSRGTACANGSSQARSLLYLICDKIRGRGEPVLLWEEECSVAFQWKTQLICPLERNLFLPLAFTKVIFSAMFILTGGVMIYFNRNNYYGGMFMIFVKNKRNSCSSS